MHPTSCRSHPLMGSRRSLRTPYIAPTTNRCTVSPQQGLPNECRRERLGHLSWVAHGKHSSRPTYSGVAISRCDDPRTSVTRKASRESDSSPDRQHSNPGPRRMAARHGTHTCRHERAQATHHSDHEHARQARARLSRTKEAARYRHCEHATLATDDDDRAGPGIGDRQGEVA